MKVEYMLYGCFVASFIILMAVSALTTDKALAAYAGHLAYIDISYLCVVPIWALSIRMVKRMLPIKNKDGKVILE